MTDSLNTHIVLYDDRCPMCTFQMRVLTWLDWFGVLSMAPVSNSEAVPAAASLSREEVMEAIHCLSRSGRIYRGARAIRFVGMRLPLAIPVALFLWLPGVIYVAEMIYKWISKNRHLLSRFFGCKEACSILPARERENEQQFAKK